MTDIDPKLAVHRSNNQNRDATPGQKAMAFAMQWPEATKGGDRKSSIFKIHDFDKAGYSRDYVAKARYVLRNNSTPEGQNYPQRCLDIMAGHKKKNPTIADRVVLVNLKHNILCAAWAQTLPHAMQVKICHALLMFFPRRCYTMALRSE